MTAITAGLFLAAASYLVGLSLWYVLTGQSNKATARSET
jgi:hypothetical protein